MNASMATLATAKNSFTSLIEIVVIAPRNVLREPQPVARLPGRARPVAHELDDGLLLRRQAAH